MNLSLRTVSALSSFFLVNLQLSRFDTCIIQQIVPSIEKLITLPICQWLVYQSVANKYYYALNLLVHCSISQQVVYLPVHLSAHQFVNQQVHQSVSLFSSEQQNCSSCPYINLIRKLYLIHVGLSNLHFSNNLHECCRRHKKKLILQSVSKWKLM